MVFARMFYTHTRYKKINKNEIEEILREYQLKDTENIQVLRFQLDIKGHITV